MRLRKMWIGQRSQCSESYVPEDVGAVAVSNGGGSVVFDKKDGVGCESGRVAVITKLAGGG